MISVNIILIAPCDGFYTIESDMRADFQQKMGKQDM